MIFLNNNLFKIRISKGYNSPTKVPPAIRCIPTPLGCPVYQEKALGSKRFGGGGAEMTQIRIMEIRICSNWELEKVLTLKPADPQQFTGVTTV